IGDHAFLSCTALTSVTIGSGVTTIGNWTFQSCTSLTAIDFLGLTQPTSVGTGWIYGTDTDLRGYAYSTSDFPSSGKNFHGLIMAPDIPIVADYVYSVSGKKATIIGYTGADSIITIPSTLGGYPVAVIGQDAFLRCTGLTSVTIPDNVTTIGEYAFYYCTSLTSMTIGRGVTTISDYAFQSCTSLTSINFLGMTPPTSVGTDWIYGTDTDLRGHAYAASNFPPSGGNFYGLVMGTAIPVAPEAPINLTVTHASGKAVLTWVAPSVGPTVTHLIYRSDSANGTYVLIASCAAANYTDATVGVGQTYWYKVSANNSVVEGAKSVAVSVHITSPSANNDVSAILALIIVVVLLLLALMVMWRSSKGHR
ncbi:MAG: leucine-rich repeat domain-containing protein, partial [Methanomassiliicoccales archaeon]